MDIDFFTFTIKPKYRTYFLWEINTKYEINDNQFSETYSFNLYQDTICDKNKYRHDVIDFIRNGTFNNLINNYVSRMKFNREITSIKIFHMTSFANEKRNKNDSALIFKCIIIDSLYRVAMSIKNAKARDNFMKPFDGDDSFFFWGRLTR
jgi:hypothetical protein